MRGAGCEIWGPVTVRLFWFSVQSGEAHLGLGERQVADEEEEATGRAHLLVRRRLRRDEFGIRSLPQPPEQRRPAAVVAVVLVRGAAGAARRGGANLGGGDHGDDRRAGVVGGRRRLLLPVGSPRPEEAEHGLLDLLPFLRPFLRSFLVCQGRLQPAVLLRQELDLARSRSASTVPLVARASAPFGWWRRCVAAAALPTKQLLHRPSIFWRS